MSTMVQERWEVGSEFHWPRGWPTDPALLRVLRAGVHEPTNDAGEPQTLFATGRAAIIAMLNRYAGDSTPTLHLPSWFCMEVAAFLTEHAELRWYHDLPTEAGPDFATLHAHEGDVVLANNIFGMRPSGQWDAWIAENPGVSIIADRTHDPLAEWVPAQSLEGALWFASLRKTLPTPDGAAIGLCNPDAESQPPYPDQGDDRALWSDRFEAMQRKAAWLSGSGDDTQARARFRALQESGEHALVQADRQAASHVAHWVWARAEQAAGRERRRANIATLSEQLAGCSWLRVISGTTFNVVVECESAAQRDGLRSHLIDHRVFPAIHWHQASTMELWSGDAQAAELASRVLTIPADQRYDSTDMERVAELVLAAPTASSKTRSN